MKYNTYISVALNIFCLTFHHALFQTFQLLHRKFPIYAKIWYYNKPSYFQYSVSTVTTHGQSYFRYILNAISLHCLVLKQIADFILSVNIFIYISKTKSFFLEM